MEATNSDSQPQRAQDSRLVGLDFGPVYVVGGTANIHVQSPGHFTPFRIIIPSEISSGFIFRNLYLGHRPQYSFKNPKGEPFGLTANLFTEKTFPPRMGMDRTLTTDKVTIAIEGADETPRRFVALVLGWTDEGTPISEYPKDGNFFCEEIVEKPDPKKVVDFTSKLIAANAPILASNQQELNIIERWFSSDERLKKLS